MNLEQLLKPKSIAVLGASSNPNTIGGRPIHFLKEYRFSGGLYPINPKYQSLQDLPCFASINDLPESVDLLIVAIRADLVEKAVDEAIAFGIKSIMIISSGFGEVGPDGQAVQDRIAEAARKAGVAVMGPNCQGFIDHWGGLPATFTGSLVRGHFNKGPISFVSQSGAMGYHFYGMAQEMGLGFSYMISSGNEAVVSTSDYLHYVLNDENTHVAAAYMEGLKDPDKLRRCARLAHEKAKPLLVMKVGRSAAGTRAASSHTGSMAGEDHLVEALFKQDNVLRIDQIGQFFDAFKAFSSPKRLEGDRIAIVSISGGAGVVMADDCEQFGMQVCRFTDETEKVLKKLLPAFGSAKNPVDLTAQVLTQPKSFQQCLNSVANDPNVDGIVVFIGLLEHLKDVLIPPIKMIDRLTPKPILVTWMACNDKIRKEFCQNNIPLYEDPSRCLYAMSMLNRYRLGCGFQHQKKTTTPDFENKCPQIAKMTTATSSGIIDEARAKAVLQQFGIPTCRENTAGSAADTARIASRIGFPVAIKAVSTQIPHKSDVGGVVLNVGDAESAAEAFHSIIKNVNRNRPDVTVEQVLISEMIKNGVELLVGLKNDPVFGPAIMVGFGGVFVEIYRDVATRLLPIGEKDALMMLQELKGYPILTGARGSSPKDVQAVVETLLRVSDMGMALKSCLAEMDINPLLVLDQGLGVKAVDALIKVLD